MNVDASYGKQFDEFTVGFEGSFGSKHVTPRFLSARYLGNMVCLEGIVTKCEIVVFIIIIFCLLLMFTFYIVLFIVYVYILYCFVYC